MVAVSLISKFTFTSVPYRERCNAVYFDWFYEQVRIYKQYKKTPLFIFLMFFFVLGSTSSNIPTAYKFSLTYCVGI